MTDYTLDTDFQIQGVGVAPASARGMKFQVEPLFGDETIHYDVWGVAGSTARYDLWKGNFTCEDLYPPAFASLAVGQVVTISGPEMSQPIGDPITRPTVPGSLYYRDASGDVVTDQGQAAFVNYQPWIKVILGKWTLTWDEWGALNSWGFPWRETN